MIMIMDGALQSIDKSYYESAILDGAGVFARAKYITIPAMRPIIAPAVIITVFTTFKQFDVVYLLTQQAGAKTGSGFHTILTYIRNNYTDPGISVSSIAKACNYSRSFVSHTFSRYMKMNLRTYINQMRVILAKHELQSGSSVALTAMVCGFSDANYFTTIFRQVVGVSASQYARNTNRRERYPLQSDSRKTCALPDAADGRGKG